MKMAGRAAFYTLGCKVNQNETENLAALFRERGYEIVDPKEEADVYILNTCTVTHLADRKSRNFIRRAVKANPQAKVVVMGCYAQISPQEIRKIPGVSLVVGTSERTRILEWLDSHQDKRGPACLVRDIREQKKFDEIFEEVEPDKVSERARAYLKIQEGCDQYCSYCIIPYARGPVRSRTLESTLRAAGALIKAGYKEIVLTGIHLGAYGSDFAGKIRLEALLEKLLSITPEVRWRLSSLEPTEVSRDLVDLMASHKNFCPHLHLPLQSGHDEILRAMNRPYTTADYQEVLRQVRKRIPGICITTDIMVGFPGETDKHFQAYLEFTAKMAFSNMHVFQYSPRRGTQAAGFPYQIPSPAKEARSRQLLELASAMAHEYARGFLGKTLQILAETKVDEALWEGHSDNYLKVAFSSEKVQRGEIVPITLLKAEGKNCQGVIAI